LSVHWLAGGLIGERGVYVWGRGQGQVVRTEEIGVSECFDVGEADDDGRGGTKQMRRHISKGSQHIDPDSI
jgi:hypothetical protein